MMIELPITDPTWIFFLVLSIILLMPMLLERLRIPAIAGLIIAGILIGPNAFHLLNRDASFELFGKVGLYYIMFLAALEMNLQEVRKIRFKALGFGLLTFAIPFVLGIGVNSWMGYMLPSAILMAAMYASHTLLPYPLVLRYGLSKRLSVNLSVGGTIVADTLTLLVLAVVGGMFKENYNGMFWVWLVLKIICIGTVIIITFPRISRFFFRKFNDGVVQYLFVLSMVFLGAGMMEIVGMEGILGAFLVGIVLNKQIPASSPLMTHIEFVGNALFIPYFLIGVGMLIDVRALADVSSIEVATMMVGICLFSKWLAAAVAQKMYRLGSDDRLLIFGLTNARAAAALAIMLVGYKIITPNGSRLLGDEVLNGVMMLILVSSIVASFVSDFAARRIAAKENALPQSPNVDDRIVIAVSKSESVDALVHLALMLRTPKSPYPLNAVNIVIEGNDSRRLQGLKDLDRAAHLAAAANVRMLTHSRWSVNVVSGLSHATKELDASDLVIGLHEKSKLFDPFFGALASDMVHALDRQILVYRHVLSLNTLRKIHIVVPKRAEYEPTFGQWADRMAFLSERLSCKIEVYSGDITVNAVIKYWNQHHPGVVAEGHHVKSWYNFKFIAENVRHDHLMVFVWARMGGISRHKYMNELPVQIEKFFEKKNLLVIFPAEKRTLVGQSFLSSED